MNIRKLPSSTKVFGIGLDRTGTTSLAKALNELDILTVHYAGDPTTHEELISGTRLTILEKYQGIIHGTSPFYQNLDTLYPGSKFILKIREKEQWLKSMQRLEKVILDRISELDEEDFQRQSIELLYKLRYGAIEFNSESFWLAYQRHQKEVIEYFSKRPNDLLTINITAGEGWEKLCPFLQVTIPKIPFPHKHRWQELKGWHDLRKAALTDLETLIPEKAVFILVDEDQLKLDQLRRKRNYCLPFLEKDRQYWGPPSDSQIAIEELERMRQEGAAFIAFVWISFWWLDFYTEFNQYLHSKFSCVLDNDHLIAFDLKHELQTHIFPEKPDKVEA